MTNQIPKLEPITAKCIAPGGVWYDVCQAPNGWWHAECYQLGHLFWITAAMGSADEVRQYIARKLPKANEYTGD